MTFADLNLNNALRNALDDLGFTEPTGIQVQAFAPIMAGNDVLGIAQTGTGKTFAYLMPLIRQWQFQQKKSVSMLVIVPTKELVVQVEEAFRQIAKYASLRAVGVYGGPSIKTQAADIAQGTDIVIGTPGRINDLLLHGTINPRQVKKLVIDEVDQLLNLGFRKDLMHLLDVLPEKRQTLMFSATMTADVETIIANYMQRVVRIDAAAVGSTADGIEQRLYEAPNFYSKLNLLRHLLHSDTTMQRVLVFAGGKRMADRLEFMLEDDFGADLAVIHANKNANKRLRTVDDFAAGKCRILVASDLLARGIDVEGVTHVINFILPDAPEDYVHRIGRTGRAQRAGVAISMAAPYEEDSLKAIEQLIGQPIPRQHWPTDVELSNETLPDELDRGPMPVKVKAPKLDGGGAFHEKLDKNKKVPIKVTRADKMKAKYGKNYQSGHSKSTR
ncbi:MAG: DEAD/DEAH box helicase [Flavobacteriales bacterium]|jgi:ATP-dependent RNA helicase RhlE